MNPKLALFASTVALTTCVHVSDERSRRDEQIGKAQTQGMSLEVSDGLAAIRELESGRLHLWAKAPLLEMHAHMSSAAPASLTITIDNVLPDAVLEAVTSAGEPLAPMALDAARPTQKRWTLTLPQDVDTKLTVRPARGEPTAPWRFALLSDVQEAIDRVQDIYGRMNADPAIEFVVSAGDLTTQGKPEQLERFQHELESLRVPFFPTLGNHELGTDDGEPFQRWFGRANFRFFYGGLQFYVPRFGERHARSSRVRLVDCLARRRPRKGACRLHAYSTDRPDWRT